MHLPQGFKYTGLLVLLLLLTIKSIYYKYESCDNGDIFLNGLSHLAAIVEELDSNYVGIVGNINYMVITCKITVKNMFYIYQANICLLLIVSLMYMKHGLLPHGYTTGLALQMDMMPCIVVI